MVALRIIFDEDISAKYFSYIGFLIFKIDAFILRPLTDLLGSLIAGHER